uniref:Uncharacterized protein n=1 Tax=Anguilla anguilla TaxID=7936 RepID=A0A0E9XAK1_ANGAN
MKLYNCCSSQHNWGDFINWNHQVTKALPVKTVFQSHEVHCSNVYQCKQHIFISSNKCS